MKKARFSYLKLTAVVAVLAMTIIAGVLLVYGRTNPNPSKFSVQDATTREDNGKRVRAKQGFELLKDGNNVSARRLNKPTERSVDKWLCGCPSGQEGSCSVGTDEKSVFHCAGSCGGCVFVKVSGQ